MLKQKYCGLKYVGVQDRAFKLCPGDRVGNFFYFFFLNKKITDFFYLFDFFIYLIFLIYDFFYSLIFLFFVLSCFF